VLFFVIGAAAFFHFIRRKPLVPVLGLAGILILWNVGVMMQSRTGEIPTDRLVSFHSVSETNLRHFYNRFGFPFASPMNWLFAYRYGVSPEKFDRLYGHEGFGNLRLPFDAASEPYVGRGWWATERGPNGRWFRWAVGSRSILLVPLKQPRDYELFAHVRAYRGASPNSIGLRVNGRPNRAQLVEHESTLRWKVEKDFWQRGVNEVSFEFARTARPSDSGSSQDSRELAAAFYRVNLISVPKDD
jgi:hypothetical protein